MTAFMLLSSLKFLPGLIVTMHHPKVCLDLSVLAKKDSPSHVYIQKFNEIKDQYSYCITISTDGSKDNARVRCGLIINNLSI